ncbi:MAG: CoB--CoM heterodisulfide reductase iron-sulfur subunit A family protein [Bacteroidales bacterium]|nr:CoB--CoM heterodisulfide reductase iron-sulfur subunit A family protein [Bacteroidales bacterium]
MKTSAYDCIIIGSGPAGLKAGNILNTCGYKVCILEKEKIPGGKLNTWHELFPHNELADDILRQMLKETHPLVRTSVRIDNISGIKEGFSVKDQNNDEYRARALLVASGFKPFDARQKEEYAYGIYQNVITSVDLEQMFRSSRVVNAAGHVPEKVAFIYCVGSRDIKVGNEFCSANCCITGIKQAIELKQLIPSLQVFCLYMDLRLGGRFFEYCYKTAQVKYKIQFIRGRLSETNENPDQTLVLRYEDTLAGRPAQMTVDMIVLLVGMQHDESIINLNPVIDKHIGPDGYFGTGRIEQSDNNTENGLFFAGSCTGPKSITQSTDEAAEVAFRVHKYLVKSSGI